VTLRATYFDGHSARGTEVELTLADGVLQARPVDAGADAMPDGAAGPWQWPLARVTWPERTRHGRRVIELEGGGTLVATDAAAFDAWRGHHRIAEGWVVRAQQHWRGVALALVLLVVVAVGGYRWGVPTLATGVVAVLPAEVDRHLGDAALASLDRDWLEPSRLPAATQQAWRERMQRFVEAAEPDPARRVPWELHLRRGGEALGANALALPGGHIVITDEMLALLAGHEDTVLGVLAHEYGHVERRHGMQAVARLALVSLALTAAFGDLSSVLLAVPVLLAQADYSRDAEREADSISARLLRASGRSPEAMVVLFEKMAAERRGDSPPDDAASAPKGRRLRPNLPIAFASHPQDDERIRFFRDEARR
jgi:Zn-dependent protease with chaperone function